MRRRDERSIDARQPRNHPRRLYRQSDRYEPSYRAVYRDYCRSELSDSINLSRETPVQEISCAANPSPLKLPPTD
jgi:hypothetical protein